ncbi:MAG: histidine--tRNA ligase [Candidatus Eisenbacteria bacterium]|nr:histidine--tRNA ligase [Candidatus Eisenbacteria bacterium]
MMRYRAPRGTRDILPEESWKWEKVQRAFEDTARRFGYRDIRLPVFEQTELFARGIGDATDIVRKEMYTFADRKGRSLTLRPEGTAGTVRAYIEHNMGESARVTKLRYFCPMFRYERPQAGRYRQFWQWGLEAIGSMSPSVDAEIIHFCVSLFTNLGIEGSVAKLNSAGCKSCTPAYNEALREHLAPRLDEFCPDCSERYERNPRRMFDCKNESCLALLADAPSILDSLCDECRQHFESVLEYLDRMSVPYEVDKGLARGLDYYTRTIFEVHYPGLGAQSALCGGGRYDDLVEELGGKPTPAVGVSAGVERLMLAYESESGGTGQEPGPEIYIVSMGERAEREAAGLAAGLRADRSVELDHQGRSMKAQMREAGRLGARVAIIVGEDELERGAVSVKDMETGDQVEVELDRLNEAVEEKLAK